MPPLLKLSEINKTEGDFALRDISFSQGRYQKIAVAGETGSGKSTLLKIIAGLVQPDSGEVVFEGNKVEGPDEKLVAGHEGIAYLSQNFELPKFLRVEQVLSYVNKLPAKTASALYKICQIDHLYKRRTDQLSGGERQRIAMARLLITSPRLILLDEPFSHLDIAHKITLKSVINDIGRKLKITCILVSHDPADTLSWADHILVMKDGAIVQSGAPLQIYRQPVSEYVGGLFGKYNLIKSKKSLAVFNTNPVAGKCLFVRPENLKIASGKNGVKCQVTDVRFVGGHFETEVQNGVDSMLIASTDGRVSEGETVFVTTRKSKAWYV
jgi:ABC-type sulfate/molybdate transport systems ATPase subunit